MNRKLRKLKEDLERAGGKVFINEDMPDHVARFFIREVENCPDCQREIARSRIPRGKGEH
jgi:hypothetical protein